MYVHLWDLCGRYSTLLYSTLHQSGISIDSLLEFGLIKVTLKHDTKHKTTSTCGRSQLTIKSLISVIKYIRELSLCIDSLYTEKLGQAAYREYFIYRSKSFKYANSCFP